MVQVLNFNGRVFKIETIDKCVNKDKCIGCKKPYQNMIYILKTGLGFCSIECMEAFIKQWIKDDYGIENYLNESPAVIRTDNDEGHGMR